MWTCLQTLSRRGIICLGWWIPSSIWRNKVLTQSTCIGPTSTTSTLSLRNRQGYRSGFVLAQYDDTGKKERAIYYLSKSLVEYESQYKSHGVYLFSIGMRIAEIKTLFPRPFRQIVGTNGSPTSYRNLCIRESSSLADAVVGVLHNLCHAESKKGASHCGSSCASPLAI